MRRLELFMAAAWLSMLALTWAVGTPTASAAYGLGYQTFSGGSATTCTGKPVDPLNVVWHLGGTLTYREVSDQIKSQVHLPFFPPGSTFQSVQNGNRCNIQDRSNARRWGRPTGSEDYSEKAHIRLFADRIDATWVAGDAHREHVVACRPGAKNAFSDAVYPMVHHESGFDYERGVFARHFHSGNQTSRKIPSPYSRTAVQCNDQVVSWSGIQLVISESGIGSG